MTWTHGAGLEGKAVVVTGAAGGIGREVAAAFADAGAHVCGVDLELEPLSALSSTTLAGGPHRAEALDVRELARARAAAAPRAGGVRPSGRPREHGRRCSSAATTWTRSPRRTGTSSTTST